MATDSAPPAVGSLTSKLDKPVRVKIVLVASFDATSLEDIADIKEVIDEAADALCGLGELVEEECKEEIETS